MSPVPLPSLVVCNINRLKWSKAQKYGMTLDMINYMFYQLQYFAGYIVKDESALKAENDFIRWRKALNFSYSDIFDNIAPSCDDIFLSVRNSSAPCKEGLIYPIDTFEYGRCQRYDPVSSALFFGRRAFQVILVIHIKK